MLIVSICAAFANICIVNNVCIQWVYFLCFKFYIYCFFLLHIAGIQNVIDCSRRHSTKLGSHQYTYIKLICIFSLENLFSVFCLIWMFSLSFFIQCEFMWYYCCVCGNIAIFFDTWKEIEKLECDMYLFLSNIGDKIATNVVL